MTHQLARFFLALVVVAYPARAPCQTPLSEGVVEPLTVTTVFDGAAGGTAGWTHDDRRPGSSYLRYRIANIEDGSTADYELKIFDANNDVVQVINKDQLAGRKEFWTDLIRGDYAKVMVVAAQEPRALRFEITHLAYQKSMGAAFSITLPDDREPIANYRNVPAIFGRAAAVAKLTFVVGLRSASCTGFMIGESRMLTNHHCISDALTCDSLVATFGYQFDENRQLIQGKQYRCGKFIDAHRELDVAMVEIDDVPGRQWGVLKLNGRDVVPNEQVYMLQHPQGEPKQIARKDCSVVTPLADGNGTNTDFGHRCDTLQGSSGSPMLGADYTVIGLHHWGFDSQVDRWRGENRAVRMSRIVDWVAKH